MLQQQETHRLHTVLLCGVILIKGQHGVDLAQNGTLEHGSPQPVRNTVTLPKRYSYEMYID